MLYLVGGDSKARINSSRACDNTRRRYLILLDGLVSMFSMIRERRLQIFEGHPRKIRKDLRNLLDIWPYLLNFILVYLGGTSVTLVVYNISFLPKKKHENKGSTAS